MADFEISQKFVERWEGSISNHPDDPGGLTVFGIAQRRHPKWEGWEFIQTRGGWEKLTKDDQAYLKQRARLFYRQRFWMPILAEQYPSQRLATIVYQAAVNCGPGIAVKWLQRSLNNRPGEPIKEDGKAGNHTLHKMFLSYTDNTLGLVESECIEAQRMHYHHLVDMDEDKRVFLKGWLNRISAL